MFRLLLILTFTLLLPALLSAENVQEPLFLETDAAGFIEGSVDWTDNVLIVYGEGVAPEGMTNPVQRRLMGFRAAKVVAFRNLLELVGQVRIDAETRVDMAMVASDSVRTRVSGIVRGARVLPGSQREVGGLYRVALRLDLLDNLADAVLPDRLPENPVELPSPDLLPGEPGISASVAAGTSALPTEPDSLEAPLVFIPPQPYTGLLVDARGLDLQPSMAPRVITNEGREVYSAGFAERSYATHIGVVGYDKDWDRALASDRLGGEEAHPLTIKALEATGNYGADLVISQEDGVRVAMADEESNFLSQCRVTFILGPEPVVDSVSDSTFIDTTSEEDYLDLPGETGEEHYPE